MTENLKTFIPKALKSLCSKDFWRMVGEYVGLGRPVDHSPIIDPVSLQAFIHSRASHVSQTSLYGYLKTRAGTRFPEMFEDAGLLMSINMAKWQIFAGCISDLTIYLGGLIAQRTQQPNDKIVDLLTDIFRKIALDIGNPTEAAEEFTDTMKAIGIRIANTNYQSITDDESAFSVSPKMLFTWSPVSDELKQFDEEIVTNSIRFRWKDIRVQARTQLNANSLFDSVTI